LISRESKTEPLTVAGDSKVGETIFVQGFKAEGEIAQLNPKKKVWDKIQAELKTNSDGEVLWKDFSLLTLAGNNVTSSLINCNVK
jgi:tyrosyl-tRNA synthetase